MSGQAGIIFAGQVIRIERQPGSGSVAVVFRVDAAVRGCAGQGTFVLDEWSGLWAGGTDRYHVGQRYLMLLHTPGTSGLTSPVGGQDGAIPLSGGGALPGPPEELVDSGEEAVDLRWIETRLQRTAHGGLVLHARLVTSLDSVATPLDSVATGGGAANPPASVSMVRAQPLRRVLAMLRSPEAEQADAAR